MADLKKPEALMEPEASLRGDRWRYSDTANNDGYALRSIAISLKRLADLADNVYEIWTSKYL